MKPTEEYNCFLMKPRELIDNFHTQNPGLFIADIQIDSNQYVTGNKVMTGLSARIEVQPYVERDGGSEQ